MLVNSCPFCESGTLVEIISGLDRVSFRGETEVYLVEGRKHSKCSNCGEEFVDEEQANYNWSLIEKAGYKRPLMG